MKQGKRLKAAYAAVDRTKSYPLAEAIRLIKANARAKFDETVEMSLNLGIDPRHADQMVRGLTNLPNGTGKTVRVGVFARGPKAEEAPPPAPTSWAPRTWRKKSRPARSTSTAASRPRT